MASANSTCTPGVGKELSLDQPEERFLIKEGTLHFQAIAGGVTYLGQLPRNGIFYAVNQLVRAMSKPSKDHMGGSQTSTSLPGRNGGFSHHVQARWLEVVDRILPCKLGQNPDNGKSMSSYPCERRGWLHGGAAGTDSAIHYLSRSRGRGASDE